MINKAEKQSEIVAGLLEVWLATKKPKMSKTNREAAETVTAAFDVIGDAVRVVQDIFSKDKGSTLRRLERVVADFRTYLYLQTSPWQTQRRIVVSRILLNEIKPAFEKSKAEFDRVLRELLSEYPEIVERQRVLLGKLFDPADYPSEDHLRRAFRFELQFGPVQNPGDFRLKAKQSEIKGIEAAMQERFARSVSEAMSDAYGKLHSVATKAAETLSDDRAVFRDSLFENIQAVADSIDGLNLIEDEDLKQIAADLRQKLAIDPNSVRESGKDPKDVEWKLKRKAAAQVAKKAAKDIEKKASPDQIADKMSGFTS